MHIILPQAAQWYSWVALALAFLLSILVYFYIENPLRRSNSKANVVFLLSALVACFTLGQVIKKMDGFPERPIAKALTFDDDFAFMKVTKESKLLGQNIRLTDENQFPEILFVGDSHAQQYAARVKLLADHTHKSVAFLTSGGCFVANGQGGNPKECAHTPESLKILLQDARIKTVVIGQIWGAYMTQNLGVDFFEGVNSYVEIMKKFGQSKKFYVLLDAPWDQGSYNITNHLNRLNYKAALEVEHYWVSYPMDDSWLKGNRYVQDAFSSLSTLIVTDNLVCPNKKCDLKNYMDDDHLRSSYIEKNAYWIDQVFQ